jgi:hypothetical protein
VCPAPFFDEEVPVPSGATLTRHYAIVIADGDHQGDAVERLAKLGLDALQAR